MQRPADGRSGQSDRSAAEVAGRGTSSAEISTSLPTAPESNLDGRDLDRSRLSLWRTGLAFSCVLAFTTLLPEFTFWLKSLHPGQTRRRRGFRSPDSRSGRPGSTDPSRRPATP